MMINKNKGLTFIELAIVIAIAGVFMLGVNKLFKNTFSSWWTTRDSVNAASDARTAMDEMSKYIRQASSQPVTISSIVYDNDAIYFEIGKASENWHEDLTIGYFQDGTDLKRFMKGSTTTLVSGGLDIFYVWIDSGSASSYDYVGASITVTQGDKSVDLTKKIMLRARR